MLNTNTLPITDTGKKASTLSVLFHWCYIGSFKTENSALGFYCLCV